MSVAKRVPPAIAMVVWLAACACSPPSRPTDPRATPADADADRSPMKKTDADPPSGEFTRGPAITPSAELITWLDGTNTDLGKRRVRLPVWLEVSGLGVKSARIGQADGPDAVKLKLNDSGLGVSVADHARRAARTGGPPALWLEGQWKGDGRFSVLKVVKPITADEAAAATYVEVEAPY